MNKYFIEILKNRTLLIIPKFGALTVANRKTGKVVFNPNLTFDDNVLSDYIAEKEGIDKTEAKNTIAKFVREIEGLLGKGETYDIFDFGKFYKNDKGEVVFESTVSSLEKSSTPVESKKVDEVKLKEEVKPEEKSTEKKENVYIPPVTEKVTEKVEKTKEKVESSLDDIKNKYKKTDKKTEDNKEKTDPSIDDIKNKYKKSEKTVTKAVKDKKEEVVVVASNSKDDIKNKFKSRKLSGKNKPTEKPKKEKKVKEKGEKKKRRILPLILLLLLLGGIGVGGYFYQDKIKDLLGMNKTAHANNESEEVDSENTQNSDTEQVDGTESEEQVNENDSLATNEENSEELTDKNSEEIVEETTEEMVEETQVEPTPVVSSSVNGNYHVIGGAFGEESNATRFAEKTGGTVLGKFNGLYQVAIKSYDTRADASAGLKQLSSEYPSAWILKYSK